MAKLYELTAEYEQLYEMLAFNDDADMEQTILDTMEGIEGEFEVKVEGYAKIIRQLETDAEAYKTEKDRLERLEKTAKSKAKWLKMNLQKAMEQTGLKKVETGLFKISVQKNGGMLPLIVDEADVPEEFKLVKYEIDNSKIRESIDSGIELGFARYGERGERLVIR